MADFNTALVAQNAMRKSIDSIFADASLNEAARVDVLRKNVTDYAEHLRLPLLHAEASVAKLMGGAGARSALIMKVAPKDQSQEAAERAAAAGRKLRRQHDPRAAEKPSASPDPQLIGEEDDEMKPAANEEVLALARKGVADGIAKIRADNPHLSEDRARERFYGENPGFRASLVKLSGREYGQRGPSQEIAKQERSSSAQIEAVAKAAEIMKADPGMSEHQAFAKAYAETPGLMRRLLDERSGAHDHG